MITNGGTLNYFPTPYPEEDIRSILYRYHIRSINNSYEVTKSELFGYRSDRNNALPSRMEALVMQLPQGCGITVEKIIEEHTLFPFFRPFITSNKERLIYKLMCNGNGQRMGIEGKPVLKQISESIKYCPGCIQRDYKKFGEVYVHRVHQIKFLGYCPTHKSKLLSECLKCKKRLASLKATKLLSTPYCDCGNDLTSSVEPLLTSDHESVNFQLQTIEWLLKSSTKLNHDKIRQHIFEFAWNNGFYRYTGMLNYEKIHQTIKDYFPPYYFEIFNHSSTLFTPQLIQSIFLSKNDIHNVFAVTSLLIMFQKGSLDIIGGNTLTIIANPLPFGAGPWKCINKNCRYYNRNNINKFDRLSTVGTIYRANFKCNDCGMIYSKKWNWNTMALRDDNIICKGVQWEIEIIKLFVLGEKIGGIALKTNSIPRHVRYALRRLIGTHTLSESEFKNKEINNDTATDIAKEVVEASLEVASAAENNIKIRHRTKIIEIMKQNKKIRRKELSNQCGRSIQYLAQYDKEWLEQYLPKKIQNKAVNKIELDDDLYRKVEAGYDALLQKKYPYQIKIHSILNMLDSTDKNSYLSHGKRLIRTNELFRTLCESKEDYLLRKVSYLYNKLKSDGYEDVTLKHIIAARTSYRNIPQIIYEKIEAILRELQGESNNES